MRIIDKEVTEQDMAVLSNAYFQRMNPKLDNGRYNRKYPAGQLEKIAEEAVGGPYENVLRYMASKVHSLFFMRPRGLMTFHSRMVAIHGNPEELKSEAFKELIDPVFGYYETFRDGARKLILEWFNGLKVNVCPYCNRSCLNEILARDGNNKFLLDIDHFFPTSEYPYFALSYFNLIPSCSNCNQRIKGPKPMSLALHMHPYCDDIDSAIYFDMPVVSIDQFYYESADVVLGIQAHSGADAKIIKRARESYEFFELPAIYKSHKEDVRRLRQLRLDYNKSQLEQMLGSHDGKLYSSKEDLVYRVVGNSIHAKDTHKKPLSKLSKDLLRKSDIAKFLVT